ncbi:hypothetical protein TWF679_007775 [Orbilia oligospora]|uniref:Chromo domain-containing protein n=1 Tax=Orbilia oligospora TaxID=2813651 RepID=A0A8H8V6L1_ORBOL|nr:hypothetical protein TWF679_007775 [Orbilia oligospora]
MARKTTVPQSQAPYRPNRASTTANTNTEPHELRDKSPVGYKNGSDTEEKESPAATQSSEGDGLWWEVRRITAERRRKRKKEYRVEWEGINKETGEPWPQEWKPCHWVTAALVEEWEARKAKKKRGRVSSSPDPAPQVEANVSKPVRISKEDIERYQNGKKRRKLTIQDPIVITSSEEDETEEAVPLNPVPNDEEEEEAGVGIGETSEDNLEPRETKSRRRRIVESSQSGGNVSQVNVNDEDSQTLSEKFVAVEIPLRHQVNYSLSSSLPGPSSTTNDKEDERARPTLSISSFGEEHGDVEEIEDSEEEGRLEEITVFGRSEEAQIQVAHTQSSIRNRREIPDSQSSGATPIHLTPAEQRPVPETPLQRIPTAISPPTERLLSVQEIAPAEAVSNSSPRPDLEDAFETIPDSSNRVFSQDVRDLQAQSQSSKESQQSLRASLPSAQLSLGKVGVTPSFQSFPDSEEPQILDDDGKNSGEVLKVMSIESPRLGVLAGKSVAGEASSFSRPDRPFQSQTPPTNLEPLTATNIPRRTQQSASVTDKDSFVTPTSFPESSIDGALELATAPEHPFEPLASHRHNTIRILQEAVESRPEDIVDSDLEPPVQPAQLENTPSHDQGQSEAAGLSNSPQLRSLESCEPFPAGLNPELLHPSPGALSPGVSIQAEDPLQGGRSASSTPCGPIPASARPTPVTVLGYLQSQRPNQKTSEENEHPSPGGIVESGAPLYHSVSEDSQGQSNIPSNKEAMSAGPISPLLKVVDIAVAPEHRASPQKQVVSTKSSGLLPSSTSSSEPLIGRQDAQTHTPLGLEATIALEKTPASGAPLIDDEYFAASQALHLLQETPRSASNEIFLAIPLTVSQTLMYKETITDRYREIEAFYGINNTQNQGGDVSPGTIERIVHDLDRISSHSQLSYNPGFTEKLQGPRFVKWSCWQSSKFEFLYELLEKLRRRSFSVALVLEAGMFMDSADLFLRSAGYQFTRFSAENGADVITPTPDAQKLRLFLVPSCDMAAGISMVIMLYLSSITSTSDSYSLALRQSRRRRRLVFKFDLSTYPAASKHKPICTSTNSSFSANKHCVLPDNSQGPLETLPSSDILDWLDELVATKDNLLPFLPLKSQNIERVTTVARGESLSTSPARKRILSQSATSSTAGAKHKRPRIEVDQTFLGRSGDNPMPDSDNFSRELGNVIDGLPTEGSEAISNIVPSADISGATTHATGAIQQEAAKSVEESAASGAPDEGVVAVNQEPDVRVDAIQEDQSDEDEESEEEILNRLNKDEVVSLLREYQAALWESKVRSDEFEQHISNREIDYQEQRDKVIGLKQTIRWQETQIEALTEQRDKSQTTLEQAIRERDQARDELKRFREALKDSEEGESERVKMMIQNMELNSRINGLEHKRQTAAKEADFLREHYQKASQGTNLLIAEKNQLEEQVEDLTRKADAVKVQLKKANMDRERAKYQHRISELTAKLERATKQIISLEVEKKRVERTRGVQTRSSSIPPRGAQSSPVPTRPGSPSMTTHRSLRNSESA